MTRYLWMPLAALLGLVPLGICAASAKGGPIPFAEARMIIEVNATDGDAGLQVFLDGEPWRSVQIHAPDGRQILDIQATGDLKNFGLTELFSESSEPPFAEFPLGEFKALFPEGEYRLVGTTVDRATLEGTATLTHDIPEGPVIIQPEEDGTVPSKRAVVSWEPASQPEGVEIAGYQVIVTREEPLRVFSVDLPADATKVSIPVGFLEPDVEYKVEVLAIEENGNQTLTEISFLTE